MPKATQAESLLRQNQIYAMICQGANRQDIIQYSSATWGLVERATDDLLAFVTKRIKQECNKNEAELREEANLRLEDLYKRASGKGKYRDALAILAQKAKINGLEIKVIKELQSEPLQIDIRFGKDTE
jgi:metal-dependent amidase/aminoacylase/carboxypeptidase family protein